MDKREKAELKITANKVRQLIIEGVFNAKSGHPGGSLSADTKSVGHHDSICQDTQSQ